MIRRTQIKKVLCVAEKNDASKGIAEIMSNGRSRRVSADCYTVTLIHNVRPYSYLMSYVCKMLFLFVCNNEHHW